MRKRYIIIALAFLMITLTAFAYASSQQVTATLDSGVTITYNGQAQTMLDVNGAVVYPIIYNGTTYVPIRAVSNMLDIPVEWNAGTRTVMLGSGEGGQAPPPSEVSLVTAGRLSSTSWWNKVQGAGNMPQIGAKFTGAIWQANVTMQESRAVAITYDGSYSTLTFSYAVVTESGETPKNLTTFKVINKDTGTVIFAGTTYGGEVKESGAVDISGVNNLEFVASYNSSPVDIQNRAIWIFDPVLQ